MAFCFPHHVVDQRQFGGFDFFVWKLKEQGNVGDFDVCPEMFFRNDDLEEILPDKSLYLLTDIGQGVTGMVICPPLGQFFPHFFQSTLIFSVHDVSKLAILFSAGKGHGLLSGLSRRVVHLFCWIALATVLYIGMYHIKVRGKQQKKDDEENNAARMTFLAG